MGVWVVGELGKLVWASPRPGMLFVPRGYRAAVTPLWNSCAGTRDWMGAPVGGSPRPALGPQSVLRATCRLPLK